MIETTNDVLKVSERIQAGSVFLLGFNCPVCAEHQLEAWPLDKCSSCNHSLAGYQLKIKHMRLLCGTKRRPGRVSKKIVRELVDLQGLNCAYCQCDLDGEYHVEHIRPISTGGTNNIQNLCLACPPCNLTASSKVFATFEAKKDYLLLAKKEER